MAYFPNAYKKVFVATAYDDEITTDTTDLAAGAFSFFDPRTWLGVASNTETVITLPKVVIAMGSYRNSDKIGSHGGYKESIKSQILDPHHVHRFWKVGGRDAQSQIIQLGWNGTSTATAPKFVCGQTYHLRIDLKGSPALRFLGHNIYHTFDVLTGCCTNLDQPENVDPIVVLLEFAKQINEDPIFSQFVMAEVIVPDGGDGGTDPDIINPATYVPITDPEDAAALVAALRLTVAYIDTKFGDCSFDPRDHYEVEPLVIAGAQLMEESGYPCSGFKQLVFTEKRAPLAAQGTGEKVLRDLILSDNYRQEFYQTDPRRREAEGYPSGVVFRDSLYTSYYILHSVPRIANPTGVSDNDLYLIQISVLESTNITPFENWITSWLESANHGVAMEDLTGVGA